MKDIVKGFIIKNMQPAVMVSDNPVRILAARYNKILQMSHTEDPFKDDPRMSRENIIWMCQTIKRDSLPYPKACRWIGFVQGVMASQGLIDVDKERDYSRPLFHKYEGETKSYER